MSCLPKPRWAKILVIFCYIIIGVLFLYILFTRLFAIAAPFVFAIAVGRILQSPIEKLHKRLHLPRRLIGFVLNLIVILFFIFVVTLIINQFVSEAQKIFVRLSENSDSIIGSVSGFFDSLAKSVPFIFERLDEDVLVGAATEAVNNIVSRTTTELAEVLTGTIKALPGLILFFTVFIISSFYFSMDYYRVKDKFVSILPAAVRNRLGNMGNGIRTTAVKYIKAYSLILFITFAELFVGFIIIGTEYSMLLALGIAILDMLPVIGTGTVLVPWAIIEFLMGHSGYAIGILVIFAVISVVRELIEPKIVGDCIGMHPLLTLLAMYTGYKLFSVLGILLLPPVVMLIKNSIEASGSNKISVENNNTT